MHFGSKTIVYSFSNCNFQRNVKLIAFLIVCDKGVYSQMPYSLVWTKNLRCFENQQKYMYHEIRQGMTRTSLRKRDSPKLWPELDSARLITSTTIFTFTELLLDLSFFSAYFPSQSGHNFQKPVAYRN